MTTEATTSAVARPDLTHLPYDTQVNVAVAVTQGATWAIGMFPCWKLMPSPGSNNYSPWVILCDDGSQSWNALPKVLTDPAAWGTLMEKELAGVRQVGPGAGWFGVWWTEEPQIGPRTLRAPEAPAATPGEAVALAVLAKYGVEAPKR